MAQDQPALVSASDRKIRGFLELTDALLLDKRVNSIFCGDEAAHYPHFFPQPMA
jgi:hypothetical protein